MPADRPMAWVYDSVEVAVDWKSALLRGFDAEPTTSMHWVREPRLSAAIERFLASETAEVDRVITEMHEHSQLKHDELDEPGLGG